MDPSGEASHTTSTFFVPDGATHPMTEEDLLIIRKERPDLDERISYAAPVIEEVHPQ